MSNIVFIGDSVTKGTGYGGVTLTDTFAYKIGIQNGYPSSNIINSGVNSDTSAGLLARLVQDVYQYSPSVCVVEIGVNDWINNIPVPTYVSNLEAIFSNLISQGISPIFLSSPVYRGTNAQFLAYRAYIRAADDVCATNNVPIVDLYRDMCQEYFCVGNNNWNLLYADTIHLSKSGHQYVADMAARSKYNGIFI